MTKKLQPPRVASALPFAHASEVILPPQPAYRLSCTPRLWPPQRASAPKPPSHTGLQDGLAFWGLVRMLGCFGRCGKHMDSGDLRLRGHCYTRASGATGAGDEFKAGHGNA